MTTRTKEFVWLMMLTRNKKIAALMTGRVCNNGGDEQREVVSNGSGDEECETVSSDDGGAAGSLTMTMRREGAHHGQ